MQSLLRQVPRQIPDLGASIRNLKIINKLNLGFGVLIALTFLVVGRSYLSSTQATSSMNRTQDLRMPTALSSANAQSNLLQMLSSVRGYLATGESEFRDRYEEARQSFEAELLELDQLLPDEASLDSYTRLQELKTTYGIWSELPNQLFQLRDNLLDNQPALQMLDQKGEVPIAVILTATNQMLEEQEGRSDSFANLRLLRTMVDFQSSFALQVSALRGYLSTRNPSFRFEYAASARMNQSAWEQLLTQQQQLTPAQRANLEKITQQRQVFLPLPQRMFLITEGERYREDLYLLKHEMEPLANQMMTSLGEIVTDQQNALTSELQVSQRNLSAAQWQTGLGGLAALSLGVSMALILRRQIADPIQRLTEVTTSIRDGNLDVRAVVESQDEVGVLAQTFNQMTDYLKESREELEHYSRTLEQRVDQRTQELQEKNEQLGQALLHLQQTQTQLIQTEKMSSLGQLVAGVAHEINNPVNFIHGNVIHASQYTRDLLELLQLYQKHYPNANPDIQIKIEEVDLEFLSDDLPSLLASMKLGAERIREIVQSLRTFSRLDEAEVKDVDIHEGLDSTLLILKNRLKSKPDHPEIRIVKVYGELPRVECYAGQLNQVFMNILSNAIDALEEQDLRRSPSELEANPGQITITTERTGADRVAIRIADNGPGMSEQVQRQLFNPFFTTKPVGKGTGLGMSISYQIVTERHGGILRCTSVPGQGSEFVVEIPIRQSYLAVQY